jgi:hypothetical protein
MAQKEKKKTQEFSCAICLLSFQSEREQREHVQSKHLVRRMGRSEAVGQSYDD